MKTRALLRSVVVALLLASGLAMVPAAAAQADDVTWTVRTVSNDLGADRTNFTYTINPGSSLEDALVITNRGATALDLGVYASDGYTTESGEFDLLVGGEKSSNIGAWVQSDTDSVTVAPGETVTVPFTVDIPANATPGDYAGGIVTSLAQSDAEQGINVDRRLGVRIALRVGGDLAPALAIENPHLDWNGGLNPLAGGDATMTYTLHNTGNAVLSAQQLGEISGPFGLLRTKAGAVDESPQLLPGESWDVSVAIADVPASFWLTATATVTPLVVDAAGSTTALTPITASANSLALPWALLLIILIAVVLVLLARRLRRRRRITQQAREDARVQEAVDAALAATSESEARETVGATSDR